MHLAPVDWAVLIGYALFALVVGLVFARRAGRDVEQYFLSGRTLPWWMAGTSMVATTFASDTPLVISGWVRTQGIWQNWLWWCTAAGGMLTVFLFARYWKRGDVMTTAELSELRYGGREAGVLRGFLGVYQALITNTIILCWVILAAIKILGVLFGVNGTIAMLLACALALSYSLLSGFWGVVVTDLVQFAMAMAGALALAIVSWHAVGGGEGILEAASQAGGAFGPDTLRFFPAAGPGTLLDAGFWTTNLTTVCVLLGVQWWAYEYVDGGMLAIQRISAARSERDGVLAYLWYAIAHFALRPWPWIVVGLASLVVLPPIAVHAPIGGAVVSADAHEVVLRTDDGEELAVQLADHAQADEPAWVPTLPTVAPPARVAEGDVLAETDPERAYIVMMKRYLPAGLLGLVIASLFAAFMSTVDTHVNLSASFFVNDLYRRFLRPGRSDAHYVAAARVASAAVLFAGGLLATVADSISDLFTFFMAFLSGVGPIYVLRWLWWRVRATTEIVAMLTSSIAATALTWSEGAVDWSLGSLSVDGDLTGAGRLVLVVLASGVLSLLSVALTPRPDPARLVPFYRRVRPLGAWGPVRALCPDVTPPREAGAVVTGALGGLAMIYGALFGVGAALLQREVLAASCGAVAVVGALLVVRNLRRLT